jgi:hypothetical protein
MARAHFVKKARKDYPDAGIKKGDSYYWWAFQYGPMVRSKVAPKPSQLTQSEFLSTVYDINERLESIDGETAEDFESAISEIVGDLENLRDETQEKHDNMPEQLQQGDTGQLLEERVQSIEGMISNLESVTIDVPEALNPDSDEAKKEAEAENADEWVKLCEDDRKVEITAAVEQRESEIFDAIEAIRDEVSGISYEGS